MGAKSKDKGRRGEREVAKLLSKWWGSDFVRTPQSGGFSNQKFRNEWNADSDVVTADETFPFSVEVKWREGWSLDHILTAWESPIWDWWEQAKRETAEGKQTLLVFKKNYQPFFIMMRCVDPVERPRQVTFIEEAPISTYDRQGQNVYIRLFSDLLEEPKEKWARNLK